MDAQHNTYRAAYVEASEELKKINREFEELSLRREKLAEVIQALQPRLGLITEDGAAEMSLMTHLDTTAVVTRVTVAFTGKVR